MFESYTDILQRRQFVGRPHPVWIHVVTGSHRWMWQQCPREREVDLTGLTLNLWRLPSGELDSGRTDCDRSLAKVRRDLLEWKGVPQRLNAILWDF